MYFPHVKACPFVELVSACDIIPQRAKAAAEKFGIPNTYASIETMLFGAPFDLFVNLTDMQEHEQYQEYVKYSDIPGPTGIFVILDEREDSIDDAYFAVNTVGQGTDARFQYFPAFHHNGACGFSFADGNAEIRRWQDPRTKMPITPGKPIGYNLPSPNNPDIAWMQDRTTRLKH